MSKAYRLKADASFPRPLRSRELLDGNLFWESAGVSYVAGDFITEDVMLPRDAERAANGELNHLLEEISEVPATKPVNAEHEAEREILKTAGKEVSGEEPKLEPKKAEAPPKKPRTKKTVAKKTSAAPAPTQAPTTNEVII